MKVTEFDVKRPQWLHGEGSSGSFLCRNDDGKMCCLGFFCLAAGCSIDDIIGVQVPHDLGTECKEAVGEQLLIDGDHHPLVVNDLMGANDVTLGNVTTEFRFKSEEEREQTIAKLFAEMGVKVNFKD